ncbi:MAG: hypothetical protein A3J63_02535 [Candidatus Moranbacteria bacterium RIFCSPHIGHO2_02_FULL_40_12b]|nr:MAG: hypothetical protein A3J63_02535 [Candidatus Moranbacteria bacterium RIFCSPHIGHO2_02_FULL_40_12b]
MRKKNRDRKEKEIVIRVSGVESFVQGSSNNLIIDVEMNKENIWMAKVESEITLKEILYRIWPNIARIVK